MKRLCVIFDLDGTLIDSEVLNSRAFIELIPEIRDSATLLAERYKGMKLAEILHNIETRYKVHLPTEFEAVYRERVTRLFDAQLRPMPGVPELLSNFQYPCCIASSAPLKKINHALHVTGLKEYFGAHIFSSYEIGSWKPAPDLLLHTAAKMDFLPSECVVVEDSLIGIEAAHAAGMTALLFNPTLTKRESKEYRVFSDMVTLMDLLKELEDAA